MILEKIELDNISLDKNLVEVGFPADELDIFAEKKLIEQHYKSLDYIVLNGEDFESNMVFFLKDEFSYIDPYIKVKLGKSKRCDEDYAKLMIDYMGYETLNHLLYLCRLCSYLGGPGFPDLIVLNKKSKQFVLVFVKEDLLIENIFFLTVAKLLGISIIPANIKKDDSKSSLEINPKEALENEMKKERFEKYATYLEYYVHKLKTERKMINFQDEVEFTRELVYKMPFLLIRKWHKEGKATKEDFITSYEEFQSSLTNMLILINTIKDQTSKDPIFIALGKAKDETTVKNKYEYIMNKFGLGESRTKEIMELFI
ncbi:MAG: hypothetical protein HY831_03385 [Candidatus Aenigmarchaeota archaeon]|nr:hypothetical protein [Candidatus Aenigmarchaeota archaeon]